ncbi:MAG TPA: AsmA family protein [Methyloceanibacter sp.]|nr:AsmA family protein [Methyloceanibacter sp.]
MRLTLIGLAVIAVIGAIVFFIGPLFISADEVRDKLLAQVESATGYRIRVDGPVHLSMFPSLDLVADDVGVAQASSGTVAEIATAKTLKFSLALRELLGGKIKMTEVTLIDPVITVPEAKAAAKAGEPGAGNSSASASLQNLSLDTLVIENGTVILPPSGGKAGKQIGALMLHASLPSIADPLEFDAKAVLDGQKLHVAGSVASLGKFLDGAATPISLSIEAPAYLAKGLSLDGTATYAGKAFALKSMTAKLGGTALAGSISADLSGEVPAITASLAGQTLDIDALLGKPAGGGAASGSGGGGASGWSDAKIDFSALKSVNARLALSAQRIVYQQIKAGPVTIQATIAGGKLNLQVPTLKLYDGAGTASLAVDASGKIPLEAIHFSLANLDGYSFLKETASFESIDGTAAIALDLTTSGASQRAIVEALAGTAKVEFTNGAIRGINIAKTVRSLSTGILSGWQESGSEKTDFAALGASFKIAKGQAETTDLHLAGPLVRMTGAGTVDLPAQALKFRVDPQVVASLEGQGGKTDLAGLGVPIMIAGPWSKPSIYPDIAGILQNPQAAYERLSKLSGGLASLKGGGVLGNTGSLAGGIIQNGKINKNALQQGAIMGLGALIGQQGGAGQAPDAAAEPSAQAAEQPAAADQQPAQAVSPQPAKQGQAKAKQGAANDGGVSTGKKGKKKQQAASGDAQPNAQSDPALAPEAAARQLMQNFLGN